MQALYWFLRVRGRLLVLHVKAGADIFSILVVVLVHVLVLGQ